MAQEDKQKQSAAHNAAGAAKAGKAIANVAKGAASGGLTGLELAKSKTGKKLILVAVALLMIPIIILAMLPTIIFGTLFGDGSDEKSGFTDGEALNQNIVELNDGISSALSAGLNDVLARIEADFQQSGCDDYEVVNPYAGDVRYNANLFIAQYCASKDADAASISKSDMLSKLGSNTAQFYSFTYVDEPRTVEGEPDPDTGAATTKDITVRIYTITYNGESYFENEVFALTDEQKKLAGDYANNLSMVLRDGSYQVLSENDYTDYGVNYDGVVFMDGSTPVVYYNQMDDRWCNAPYGTDNVGHYGCGPTSMAIVVSSLSDETVDPPHMALWAYQNGHWCSGSGSYHSVVPGAAKAWGLNVETCRRDDPQKLADALASGKLVVAIMGPGHFTSRGHFIVLRGVTSAGKILVADPASYKRSGQEWDISVIMGESSVNAASNSPFWIISKAG